MSHYCEEWSPMNWSFAQYMGNDDGWNSVSSPEPVMPVDPVNPILTPSPPRQVGQDCIAIDVNITLL